jgi:hypothetical protein
MHYLLWDYNTHPPECQGIVRAGIDCRGTMDCEKLTITGITRYIVLSLTDKYESPDEIEGEAGVEGGSPSDVFAYASANDSNRPRSSD